MPDLLRIGDMFSDSDGCSKILGSIIVQVLYRCKILFRLRARSAELLQLKRDMVTAGMVGRDFIGAAEGGQDLKLRLPAGDHVGRF
jgi:hypothetical protein